MINVAFIEKLGKLSVEFPSRVGPHNQGTTVTIDDLILKGLSHLASCLGFKRYQLWSLTKAT